MTNKENKNVTIAASVSAEEAHDFRILSAVMDMKPGVISKGLIQQFLSDNAGNIEKIKDFNSNLSI